MKLIEFIAKIYEPKSRKQKIRDTLFNIGFIIFMFALIWVVIKIQT